MGRLEDKIALKVAGDVGLDALKRVEDDAKNVH